MKIIVITQDAPLYLPAFSDAFFSMTERAGYSVEGVVVLSPLLAKDLWKELKNRYVHYGLFSFIRMGFLIAKHKAMAVLAGIFPRFGCYSINNVLAKYYLQKIKANSVNSPDFIDYVKKNEVDLVISMAATQIFKKALLEAPRCGCINYHSAPLPRYRGLQPLFWAMFNGEKETAISVHEMDERLDNGPIIIQKEVTIEPNESLHSLYLKTISIGPRLLFEAVQKIAAGSQERIINDASQATYFSFPTQKESNLFRLRGKKFF